MSDLIEIFSNLCKIFSPYVSLCFIFCRKYPTNSLKIHTFSTHNSLSQMLQIPHSSYRGNMIQ